MRLRNLAAGLATLSQGAAQFGKTYEEGQRQNALDQFSKDIVAKYPNNPELQSAVAAKDTTAVRQILSDMAKANAVPKVDTNVQTAIESATRRPQGSFGSLQGIPVDTAIKIAGLGQKEDATQSKTAGNDVKASASEMKSLRDALQKTDTDAAARNLQLKNARDMLAKGTVPADAVTIQLIARGVEEGKGRMSQQVAQDLKVATGAKDIQTALNYISGNPQSYNTPEVRKALGGVLDTAQQNYDQSIMAQKGMIAAGHINSGDSFLKNGQLTPKAANLLKLHGLDYDLDPNSGIKIKTPSQTSTVDFSQISDPAVRERAQALSAGKSADAQQQILNNAIEHLKQQQGQ